MASLEQDSERLKGALGANDVEQRIVELETTLEDLSKRNATLRIDLEKERSDKQTLVEAKAVAERSKVEAMEKLADIIDSERRLREREASNLESLSQQRDNLNTTQRELNLSRQTIIQNSIEMEKMSSIINILTTDKRTLKNELDNTESRIHSLSSQIEHLQSNYDELNESAKSKRSKLMQKINDLQTEKMLLADQADQLRTQLEHARIHVNEVELKLAEITRQNNQLELSLGSTSKAYRELEKIYNEYTVVTHKKVATFESKIEIIGNEKEDLVKQKKELELQLLQERELRKANFGQMTGVTESSTSKKPTSNLLRLIQDYRDLQRCPEDIFQDFFDLRAKLDLEIQNNINHNSLVEKFDRLYREMKITAQKNICMANDLKKQQDENKQISDNQAQLQRKCNSLQKEKDDLSATLNDTTYQLQHLLAEIQKRNEPVPVGLKETASLLRDALIEPTIPHNQLVFNNVAQLQDINKDLTLEIRTLNQQLREAQDQIKSSEISRDSDTNVYKAALDEAERTTTELGEKVKDLQMKLEITTTECNNYKRIVSELGDGDATAKFQQIQDTQRRQREEMDVTLEVYRKETMEEINKLKEELSSCRNSERAAKKDLANLIAEKHSLITKVERLSSNYQRVEQDSKSLGRTNNILNERIVQKDEELSNLNMEIAEQKARIKVLSEERNSLKARYDSTSASYNDFKENAAREHSEKSQMMSLLEALQTRLDVSSTAGQSSNERSLETIERLNRELQHARDTVVATEKQLDYYKSIDQTEIQEKYKESVIEVRLLKTKIVEMEQKLSDATQERIIAQTKLVAAEEQLKAALSSPENASTDAGTDSICEEHVRLLAVAEDRVRLLEDDNNAYQAIIAEKEKLLAANYADHDRLINNTQSTIDELLKDIEERNASVQVAQQEAEKSITEYNALKEKFAASQAEISAENASLEEKVKALEVDVTAKQEEIDKLKQSIEVSTTALTEALSKLESESKIAEEQRQTINALRSDVSNLTFEISQYKTTIANVSAREVSLKSELEHEFNERAASNESWKQKLAILNKQQEELAQLVTDLIAKHAEWAAANDKQNRTERAGFMATTEEIVKQLREANNILRIEKDACELNYQNERNKLRRKENELDNIKAQVATMRADISRLREDNKALAEQTTSTTISDKMQYEAFKIQNQSLIMENTELREAKQKALNELDEMEAKISPLQVKISTLEAELAQANSEVIVLQKSQKEWTARSAKLLSKFNRVDPAEIESLKAELETTKAELETTKAELEALKVEKTSMESSVEELQAQLKSNEAERLSLAHKTIERGRIATHFRKKFEDANTQLEELTKEAKSADSTNTSKADMQKLSQEKDALEVQLRKLEEAKTKLDETNKVTELAKTTAETTLKQRQEELDEKVRELTALEKKYANLLKRARAVQIEKNAASKELEALKATRGTETNTAETVAQITRLEEELTTLRKQVSDQSVEATRYKAQVSVAQNKATRLQKEVETLKAQKSTYTLSPTAPVFQVGGSPISSPRIPDATSSGSSSLPTQTKSPISPSKNSLFKMAVASNVNTPELSSTPVPAPIDSPLTTPVDIPARQEDEEPVIEEPSNEEAIPTTPDATTTAEIAHEADFSMQVDSDLGEESELDKQLNGDEAPVEVEVEVHLESEKPESPSTLKSPIAEAETDTFEEMVREDEERDTEAVGSQDVEEEDAAIESNIAESNVTESNVAESNITEYNVAEASPVEADTADADVTETDANVAETVAETVAVQVEAAQDNSLKGNDAEANAVSGDDQDESNKDNNEPPVVTSVKRERDDENEDISGLESPTKKAHQ